MALYKLFYQRQPTRYLRRLGKGEAKRITNALKDLAADPDGDGLDVTKLKGREGYRLRVGDYRVIFERDDKIRVVTVERIAPRGDVYKQ